MEIKVGQVIHYFSKAEAAAIKMTDGELHTGDTIHIKGHTTDFEQEVSSIQIENQPMEVVKAGDDIGIKVKEPVRKNDLVYKVTED